MPARNLFVLLIVAMVASVALAIPNEIQYQGKLTDTDGIGMNGDFEMSFRIFDAPTAGTLLWTELHHAPADEVTVTKGLFDVLLGSLTPIALDFSVDYWLEITVDGNILLPRVKLSSSPYAYRAAIADSVVGGSAVGDTALWQVHVTDPLIFPKNNTNVLFYDDGEDMTIYAENALATGTGTSVIYGYANGSSSDPTTWELNDMNSALKGYVDFGENFSAGVAGFYDGWGTPSAAVLGSYITGTDEIGALGYYDGSYFIGVYGQQGEFGDYAGWFNGNFHLEPQPEPLTPLHGDIYADDATNKAYFFNGTDWVDMTATPGAGSSQWTDHAVDPYIFANNNANIQAYDATEDTFFMVNAFGSSAGTAIRGLGDYGPADSCLGYLGYGGELIGHPEFWYGAGVYGYSEASVDAVYGFAADGGNGVFGVTQGLNDEFWRFAGVRGYNADSLTDGRLGTWHYGGEFVKGIWLEPGTAPWESEGAIYANSSDNNLYYYDGTSWVDLTAVGAGVGGGGTVDYIPLWTPDGSTLGDSRIQQNATTTFINSAPVMQANFSVYTDELTDLHAIVGSNLNGSVVDGSSWDFYGSGGTGVMGINETAGQYKAGLHGIVWSAYNANIAGVVGSNELNNTYGALSYYNGTNWFAGWFNGNFHLEPQPTAIPLEGNLHANSSDNNLYYYDGTSWVDLTAGGGTGQWEDAGDYKRVIGNDAVRAYESGFDYGLWAYAGSATYWGALGYKDSAGVYGSGYDCYGMLGSDKSLSADMFGYGTWGDAGVYGDGEDWTVGVFGRSDWAWGVVGVTNNSGADYSGVLGQNTTNQTQGALGKENYGVWGDQGLGTHAGWFDGAVHIEPSTAPGTPAEGDVYSNGTDNNLYYYDGTSWVDLTAGGGGGIGGGGTANYIPLWTPDGSTLGDSKIRDEGTYTLIHNIGSTPVKPGNFSAAADNSSDYFGIWASNSGGTTTAGTAWTHDGVGGGGLLSNNSSSSPKYFAAIMGFNWSDAETTAAVVGADDNSSNFGALAYRANSKTWAGYFSGDVLINSDEDTTNNDYLYFGNDNHYLVWVPGGDRFVFTNSVVPNLGNSFDLGHTSWRWRDIYGHKVVTDSITLGGVTRGTWPTGGADDDWQITGDGIAPDTVYNDEDIICMGSASPTPLLPGWWQMVDIDATGYPIGLYVSGANSYPIAARWSGSSAGAAISAINTGTGGDAIQASADGTGRSAIAAWGSAGVTTAIYADADGADKAGLFLGDVDVIGDADGLYAENIQDAPHSAIYGYATQIATSSDYVNIGVRGYGKGFNSGWGVGVGVMGMANADSSYDVAGVYGYLTADGTYPEYISGYEDAAIHGNGNDLGYSGWFANGPFHLPTLAFAPTGLRGDIYSNTTDNNLYYYDGTSWVDLTAGGGGGVGGSGTANYIPLWTPDGSTLGDSRIEQNTNSVYINANPGMTSAFAVYCNTSGSGTEYNGIFGDNKYGNSTTGTNWDFGECGAGVFGLNEIDTEYRAGVVGVAWGVYGDHTAGVVGANSDGSVYGGLGYRIDDIDYAGYFAGDVNITGDLTVDGTLDVDGYLKLDAVNNTSGQTTWNSTYAGGNALRLNANTSAASVYIQNASTGWGLSAGVNDATSTGYGVYGFQYGTGYAVYGKNYNASGTGVRGINDDTGTYGDLAAPSYGVYGYYAPDQYGYIASTNYGLYGRDDSDNYGYVGGSSFGVCGYHFDGNLGYLAGSAYGVYGDLNTDDYGDYAIYGYGVSTSADSGTGYTNTASMGGVKGYNFYGNPYTFGVAGYSYLDYDRSGGAFGSKNNGTVWGSMGYQNSSGAEYGGYFTSYTSGAGRARPMPDEAVSGIGFGSYGDFLGGWVRGDVGGLMIKGGELFASYTDGIAVTNDVSVTLTETSGDERAVSYSVQSMSVDIYDRGIGRLEEGSRRVDFADDFASMISDEEIPVVTVTPLGCCNGVYISEIDKDGFTVVENSGGRSDIQFTWIAIGTRDGYENGVDIHPDVRSAGFDRHIDGAMFNDSDTDNNAQPIWWDGSNLQYSPIPDISEEERMQLKQNDPAFLEAQEMEREEAELRRQETERQRQIELRRKQEIELEKKQSSTMRDGAVVTPAEVAE